MTKKIGHNVQKKGEAGRTRSGLDSVISGPQLRRSVDRLLGDETLLCKEVTGWPPEAILILERDTVASVDDVALLLGTGLSPLGSRA